MSAHTFNPGTQEEEEASFCEFKANLVCKWVPGEPGLLQRERQNKIQTLAHVSKPFQKCPTKQFQRRLNNTASTHSSDPTPGTNFLQYSHFCSYSKIWNIN